MRSINEILFITSSAVEKLMRVFCLFVLKASKNKQELSFYSIPEFDEWKKHMENHKAWKIKYYKGLFKNK